MGAIEMRVLGFPGHSAREGEVAGAPVSWNDQ